MSAAPTARLSRPGRLTRIGLTTAVATLTALSLVGIATPAGAAPVALPRETCTPIPGLPCLPDSPLPGAPTATSPAAITGTPKVDEVLTAVEPTWDNPLTLTTYQWQRDGVDQRAGRRATEAGHPQARGDIRRQHGLLEGDLGCADHHRHQPLAPSAQKHVDPSDMSDGSTCEAGD